MDKFNTQDRLARLLFFRESPLGFFKRPFYFALISALLMAVFYIVAARVSGTLTTKADSEQLGLFDDWVAWFWIIILNPIVIGYYPWLSTKNIVKDFFDYLVKNKVMTKSNEDYLDLKKEINIYKDKKSLLYFIVFGVTSLYSIAFFDSKEELPHWASTALFPRIATTIIATLVMYIILREAVILIINFTIIRKIINNNKFKINPWLPDKCGGLKPINNYILQCSYLLSIMCTMIVSVILQFYIDGVLQNFLYMLVTIPIFIFIFSYSILWTLHDIHIKMEKSRIKYLNPFGEKLDNAYRSLFTSESSQQNIEKFLKLESSYKLTINTFPVWPFDVKYIQTWIPIIIPIIVPIIQQLIVPELIVPIIQKTLQSDALSIPLHSCNQLFHI